MAVAVQQARRSTRGRRLDVPSAPQQLPPPSPPIDLDLVCSWWRTAFDAARFALDAAGSSVPPAMAGRELQARVSHIAHERAEVSTLLAADAREHHFVLRRPLDAPPATKERLGIPRLIEACVFDLDGVLTASADLHAAAWAETFDEFLAARLARAGVHFSHFARFSRRADYDEHVHGKPRLEGVRAFLDSRGITLPEGKETDPPGTETVHGLANRKNDVLQRRLQEQGVRAFDSAKWYLAAAEEAGLRRAVVSASSNAATIIARAGLADLVDACVDGTTMRSARLRPKPAPDVVLAACAALRVEAKAVAAFTTTPAGVAAARAAGCALVVGVDRAAHGEVRASAPDVVVTDVGDLLDPELRA